MLSAHLSAARHSLKSMPDAQTTAFIAAAAFFVFMPLEISHLISALIGASVYLILQKTAPANAGRLPALVKSSSGDERRPRGYGRQFQHPVRLPNSNKPRPSPPATVVDPCNQPSAQPVQAPTFQSVGLDAEMDELISQITPSRECEAVVAKIAQATQRAVRALFPSARVTGFVNARLSSGKAFGVAVPEVELVMSLSPALMSAWHENKSSRSQDKRMTSPSQIQKSMIRACTDRLVNVAGFKFRRSAFREAEPKVTLLVPATAGIFHEAVPLSFSVNAPTPLHTASLLEACAKVDPRAKALILAVKRWAKDRGVCHAAKGHLSPYAWTVLSVYFLQSTCEEGPFLPRLEDSPTGPEFLCNAPVPGAQSQKSVGALFADFMRFYRLFEWTSGAVSLLASTLTASKDGLAIEDPFDASMNLAASLTEAGLVRLREELARGEDLCSTGASLQRLLEPWAPSDADAPEAEEREEK